MFTAVAEHLNLSQAMAVLLDGEVELFTDQIGVKHGWIQTEQGGRTFPIRIPGIGKLSQNWDVIAGYRCIRWVQMLSLCQ